MRLNIVDISVFIQRLQTLFLIFVTFLRFQRFKYIFARFFYIYGSLTDRYTLHTVGNSLAYAMKVASFEP